MKAENKKKILRISLVVSQAAVFFILSYLIVLPLWPMIQQKIHTGQNQQVNWQNIDEIKQKVAEEKKKIEPATSLSPENQTLSEEELIIAEGLDPNEMVMDSQLEAEKSGEVALNNSKPQTAKTTVKTAKIKTPTKKKTATIAIQDRVMIPKIGVNAPILRSKNYKYALNHGSWLDPQGSTPDKGGNTIVTGHRFKYLPPNNLTFYLLDKMEKGDMVAVVWKGKDYYYKVRERKIISPKDTSVLRPSDNPVLTLFTCHPVFSEKQRLVVVADLVKSQ